MGKPDENCAKDGKTYETPISIFRCISERNNRRLEIFIEYIGILAITNIDNIFILLMTFIELFIDVSIRV